MNGNINILAYTINKELEEIKGLIQDFRIKQKIENIKQNINELEKISRAKENYFKILNKKGEENADNQNE